MKTISIYQITREQFEHGDYTPGEIELLLTESGWNYKDVMWDASTGCELAAEDDTCYVWKVGDDDEYEYIGELKAENTDSFATLDYSVQRKLLDFGNYPDDDRRYIIQDAYGYGYAGYDVYYGYLFKHIHNEEDASELAEHVVTDRTYPFIWDGILEHIQLKTELFGFSGDFVQGENHTIDDIVEACKRDFAGALIGKWLTQEEWDEIVAREH